MLYKLTTDSFFELILKNYCSLMNFMNGCITGLNRSIFGKSRSCERCKNGKEEESQELPGGKLNSYSCYYFKLLISQFFQFLI